MEKKNVLVCDYKRVFIKMFRKSFDNEFKFIDNSFIEESQYRSADFDHYILVIYEKKELIDFLKLYKKGSNILVFVFNKQLYASLSFLEEIKDLVLLDASRSKKELIVDLNLNLKRTLNFRQRIIDSIFPDTNISSQSELYNTLKNLIVSSMA